MRPMSAFQIWVEGHVDARWTVLFQDFSIEHQFANGQPVTILTGQVADQAALYGMLNQLRDLGATLVRLERQAPNDLQKTNSIPV